MKYLIAIFILLLIAQNAICQSWNNSSSTTTSDWNTSIQLSYTGWGAQNGILFNCLRANPVVDGPLSGLGNTKYAFADGGYGNGAGAIMFLGNKFKPFFGFSKCSTCPATVLVFPEPAQAIILKFLS